MTKQIRITQTTHKQAKNIPKNWCKPAHALWQQGKKVDAIQSVISEINRVKASPQVELFAQAGFYLYFVGDYKAAATVLQQALDVAPDNAELRKNLIVSLNQSGDYQAVIDQSNTLLQQHPEMYDIYDSLTVAYARLGQAENAKAAGTRALQLKHRTDKSGGIADWQVPCVSVDEFVGGKVNVVAFSLFGQNGQCHPRYLYGAIRNLSLMGDIYPDWQAWIYLDDSIPQKYQQLFEHMGAMLKKQPNGQGMREKLCWRFQVANETEVGRFLVRDVDSVINTREQHAVQAWIASEKYFHTMRDWWSHTDLILAGMWGGVAGVLPNVVEQLANYKGKSLETPNIDQWFLRDCLWQYISQNLCSHDRFFELAFDTVVSVSPWQKNTYDDCIHAQKVDPLHIGSCEWTCRNDYQRKMVKPWLQSIGEPLVQVRRVQRASADSSEK